METKNYLIIQRKNNAFDMWSMAYLEIFNTKEEAENKLNEIVNIDNKYDKNYMNINDYKIFTIYQK